MKIIIDTGQDGTVINARVRQKAATLAEWQSKNPEILDGEMAFIVTPNGEPMNFKIGEGNKRFNDLPFWVSYDQGQYFPLDGTELPDLGGGERYAWAGPGTYTQSGGPGIVVPSGNMGILFWDGSVWTLGQEVEMPMPEVLNSIDVMSVNNPINSYAVVDRLQSRTEVDGFIDPPAVQYIENFYINHGGFQAHVDYDCYIYNLDEDIYITTKTDASQARYVWLMDGNFRSSNNDSGRILLDANTVYDRYHISREDLRYKRPSAKFVAVNRKKENGITKIETAPTHSGPSERLTNSIEPAYILNVHDGKVTTGGVSGNLTDDTEYVTYDVLWESEMRITFHSAPELTMYGLGALGQNITRVVAAIPQLGDKELNGYVVPAPWDLPGTGVSLTNSSASKYLRFSHKKGNDLSINTVDSGSNDWRDYRHFKGRGVFPDLVAEFFGGKIIDQNGDISDLSGGALYIIDTKSVLKGKVTIVMSSGQTNKFALVLDEDGDVVEQIDINGNVTLELTDYNGYRIAFSFDQDTTSSYVLWDLWIREDLTSRVVNVLDYAQNSTSVGITPNWTHIFNELMKKLNSIGGGVIYAPAGVYHFYGNAVTPLSNVSIKGEGMFETIFMPINNSFLQGDNLENVTYEDFTVDGHYQDTKGSWQPFTKGFYVQKLRNATFRNLVIKNTSRTGLGCDHFINGLIENVIAEGCGKDGDLSEPSGAMGCSGIGIGVGAFNRGSESLTIVGCHANNNKQNGIFIEQQGGSDHPTGYSVIGCTAEGNRIGFGCSGGDNSMFIGCTAVRNHQSGFSYDNGTLNSLNTTGKNVKYFSCIAKENGLDLPVDYPEFAGMPNGYGFYVKENFEGVEFIGCESFDNLKSGVLVHKGISNLNLQGGKFYGNGVDGIELRGDVDKFKLSPLTVENNEGSGISIDGDISNGFIKDFIATGNKIGVNKKSGLSDNVIVKDVLSYGNSESDFENITTI